MESSEQNSSKSVNVRQHVNRKCSDELLWKFSDSGDEGDGNDPELVSAPKRRRRSSRPCICPGEGGEYCDSSNRGRGGGLVERRSLLPTADRRRSVLLRRLGIRRSSQLSARDMRMNRSLLGTIEKTWRKTVEGASRVLMEKYYNRHKRLISDSGKVRDQVHEENISVDSAQCEVFHC